MLRDACLEDADSVASVLIESRRQFLAFAPAPHSDDGVRRWVRQTLVPAGRVVVAEVGGKVIAVLSTSEDATCSWIDQLYVAPRFTNRGFGGALLQHAHKSLQRPIRLYTFQANWGARRFYERHGYTAVAFTDGRSNEERCPDVLYELVTNQFEPANRNHIRRLVER